MKELFKRFLPGLASALKQYTERLDFTSIKWNTLELSRCVKHFRNFIGNPWIIEQNMIEMLDLVANVVSIVQADK